MTALPRSLESGLQRKQLPGLDSLRAVAAFMVVFYHFGVPYVSGGLGVLMFFVLSGFLITWLMLQENDRYGTVSLRKFYARRALRIFPPFYCYSAILLAYATLRHRDIVWPQALAALFYVNNYYQAIWGDPNTGFSHTWSLAIEEQYYLLWPLLFLALRSDYRRAAKFLLWAIGAVWVYRALLVFAFQVHEGYIYEAFDTRADHLLIGCLLAMVLRTGTAARLWEMVCGSGWKAGLVVALLGVSNTVELIYGSTYRDGVGCLLNPVLTAILIAQLISIAATPAGTVTNWPWVRYLGRISYSIYLYQQLLVDAPKKFLASAPFAVQLLASVGLITAVASASFYLVERPFLRWKARFEQRPASSEID
jgi:peptidoglycan/LPS O-acetylase OafA/YrhL